MNLVAAVMLALVAGRQQSDTLVHIASGHVLLCGNYLPPPHVLELRDSTVVVDDVIVFPSPCRPKPSRKVSAAPRDPANAARDALEHRAADAAKEARLRGASRDSAFRVEAEVLRSSALVDSVKRSGTSTRVWYKGLAFPVNIMHVDIGEPPPRAERWLNKFKEYSELLRAGAFFLEGTRDRLIVPSSSVPQVLADIERIKAGLSPLKKSLVPFVESIRSPSPLDSNGGER